MVTFNGNFRRRFKSLLPCR